MEQNIIGLGFDVAKFDAQKKHIAQSLLEIYELSKGLSGNIIAPGAAGGWAELTAKVKAQEKALRDLQDANLKYAESIADLSKGNKEAVQSTNNLVTATEKERRSLEELIEARRRAQTSMNSYIKSLKEDYELLKAGTITRSEYNKRINDSTIKIEQYKNQVRELNKDIKSQTLTLTQQGGAYQRLNEEYKVAQLRAKDLAAAHGIESAAAKAAALEANNLSKQLLAIDQTVGQSQRNVGNYPNALNAIWGGLRKIAYVLPGLGIAGLIGFLTDPIIKWMSAVEEATGDAKILSDTISDGAKSASEQAARLEILRSKLTDLSKPESERVLMLREYNKVADEGNKIDETQINNLKLINEQLDKQVALIQKQAIAKAAQSQIATFAEKAIEDELKLREALRQTGLTEDDVEKSLDARLKKQDKALESQRRTLDGFNKPLIDPRNLQKSEESIKLVDTKLEGLLIRKKSSAMELQRVIQLLMPDLTTDGLISRDKKAEAAIKESTKEILDVEFELYKIAQNRKLKLMEAELADTQKVLGERLVLADKYNSAQIELAEKTTQKEIKIEQDKLSALQQNLKAAKGTERNNIEADIQNTNSRIKILSAKGKDDLIQIELDYQKRLDQITKDEEEKRVDALKRAEAAVKEVRSVAQSAIDADEALKIANLDKLFSEGVIKRREYEQQKKEIQNQALIFSLTIQRKELEGLREVARARGEDLTKYENQINKLTGLILSAQSKTKEGVKKTFEDNIDEYLRIEMATLETIRGLVDAKYQRELDQIQMLIDKNNEYKDTQLANIQASTLSEQEKAAQIEILNAQTAAKNEQLARKAAQTKRRQAEFDRKIAIIEILSQAAVAAFKLIAQNGTIGIAEGIAIGAEAASKIALLMARGIPEYGDGTENHPGGGAIIGELYKPEAVTIPGKQTFVVDKPTFFPSLAAGTKVRPLTGDEVNNAMYRSMLIGAAASMPEYERDAKLDGIRQAVLETGRQTYSILKKQKQSNISINVNGIFGAYIAKNVIE